MAEIRQHAGRLHVRISRSERRLAASLMFDDGKFNEPWHGSSRIALAPLKIDVNRASLIRLRDSCGFQATITFDQTGKTRADRAQFDMVRANRFAKRTSSSHQTGRVHRKKLLAANSSLQKAGRESTQVLLCRYDVGRRPVRRYDLCFRRVLAASLPGGRDHLLVRCSFTSSLGGLAARALDLIDHARRPLKHLMLRPGSAIALSRPRCDGP